MSRAGFGVGDVRHTAGSGRVAIGLQIGTFGVAFAFSTLRPVGRYHNGDWWVLGPVTITAITPASSVMGGQRSDSSSYTGRAIHGTMINPGNRSFVGSTAANIGSPLQFAIGVTSGSLLGQGFDSYTGTTAYVAYNAAWNVDPGRTGSALVVAAGNTVVKCLSDTNAATLNPKGDSAPARFVTLTVVDAIPAPDAIRPGMSRASTAPLVRASDFDLSVFKNLEPVAGTPDFATAYAWVSGTFNTFQPSSIESANMMPKTSANYGREVANRIHAALLCLHLNSFSAEQKRAILIQLASMVDDVVSRAEEGGMGYPSGGGNQWKKPALAILCASLGAKAPASWVQYCNFALNPAVWAEDTHFGAVTEYDIMNPRLTNDGRPRTAFSFTALGSADFGNWGTVNRADAGMNMDLFYRDVLCGAFYPGILAVELTAGAKALWNNERPFLYMRTHYHRRNNPLYDITNRIQPFPLAMAAAYRTPRASAPQIVDAQVRGNAWRVLFDDALDELVTAPATGDFTVRVNGTPVSVASIEVWRQAVGGTLATPVSGTDVVTISYAPGSSPLRSVDAVNVAAFTNRAAINRTENAQPGNTMIPVVRFTPGVIRTLAGTIASGIAPIAAANTQVCTFALLGFKIDAAPGANSSILASNTGAGAVNIYLNTNRTLDVRLYNASGTAIARFTTPALTLGVRYDILVGVDMTQANAAAGMACTFNGVSQALSLTTFVSGQSFGWTLTSTTHRINPTGITFELGAFWLTTEARVDITSASERAKFAPDRIGARGDGVTGAIPAQFLVGNAAQWNDGFGMQRGSAAGRWFPALGPYSQGSVTAVVDQEWGRAVAPTVAPVSASVNSDTPKAITLLPSGLWSSLAVASGPANGTVSISGAVATYTPNPGFTGSDSFTYTATGLGGTSAPATVNLTVQALRARTDNTVWTTDMTTITTDQAS